MLRRFLEAIGLCDTYAERYARTASSLHPALINALHAIKVQTVDEETRRMLGWYSPALDTLALNLHAITLSRSCINNTMAHELIHATGHHKRLNRGHVGVQSELYSRTSSYEFYCELPSPTQQEEDSEEAEAQYGGMLLLKRLGIESPGIEEDTKRYLARFNRPDGLTLEELIQAEYAVEYILHSLKQEENNAA
jgi:antirestriction protein ArdC